VLRRNGRRLVHVNVDAIQQGAADLGLPEHFQNVTAELREFIQEQNPVVRQADFFGARRPRPCAGPNRPATLWTLVVSIPPSSGHLRRNVPKQLSEEEF